jgi:hypothetical protein
LGYGEVAKLIAEGILNKLIENENKNETKPQTTRMRLFIVEIKTKQLLL